MPRVHPDPLKIMLEQIKKKQGYNKPPEKPPPPKRGPMREEIGDLWQLSKSSHKAVVITTNGTLKGNGKAVMGAGCAKEATGRSIKGEYVYPNLARKLGQHIKYYGNVPGTFGCGGKGDMYGFPRLYTFPTKHNWWERGDLELIEESAKRLVRLIGSSYVSEIYIPRPGCGLGELKWEDVKPVIEPIFDDRYIIVSRSGE